MPLNNNLDLLETDSHRMLVRLVDNLPGMIYRHKFSKGDWKITFVSKGVKGLIGYEQAYFMENREAIYAELIAPEDYKRIWKDVNKAVAEKRPFQLYYRMKTASGEFKWVWEQGQALFNENGAAYALEGFVADVTQQKELEIKLHNENLRLKASMQDRYHFGDIIGKSAAMQQVYEFMQKAAASSANVIVYGESGTGKELVARMIHKLSQRGEKAFVPVNCGAIPETLLESEFFGYKKGAFTGATTDRKGYLAAADGGTLFLDELGDLPQNFQVKLLRVVEGQGYTRLGDIEVCRPDLRIVAATHKNMLELLGQNQVREDFFYRIHILPVSLPPLRERKGDIPLLIDHFLEKYNPEGKSVWMADELSTALKGYDWPGNVRELQNTIQRYVTLGNIELACGTSPRPMLIPGSHQIVCNLETDGLRPAVETYEKELIVTALESNRWSRDKTAKMLNITPRTLYRKMKRYEIE
jgi:PAS domain S-box-containing protein